MVDTCLVAQSCAGERGEFVVLIELIHGQAQQTFEQHGEAARAVGTEDAVEIGGLVSLQGSKDEVEGTLELGIVEVQGILAPAAEVSVVVGGTVDSRGVHRARSKVFILAQIYLSTNA